MAGANKRGIHLAELKKAILQKQTEVETTKSSKKYEKKPFKGFHLKYCKIKRGQGHKSLAKRNETVYLISSFQIF